MDIEAEMVNFASYYAGVAVGVLVTGYFQVSDTCILFIDQHLGSET